MTAKQLIHNAWLRSDVMEKDGIGTVIVCSDRLLRRVRHASFYPALEPSPEYPIRPVERIRDLLDAASPAEAIRRLGVEGEA